MSGWNIACYNAACADHTALADRYTAAYGDISGKPAIASDVDRLCVLQIICAAVRSCANIALLTEKRVHRRKQAAIRPEEHIVANRDRAAVENGEIKICVAILAKIRKYAVVKIHRPLQKQPRLSVRRKLSENFCAQLFLVLVECEVIAEL